MSAGWEIIAGLYVLNYPFAMKYLVVLVIVILLVRIDLLLHLFERTSDKVGQLLRKEEIPLETRPTEIISIAKDRTLITPDKQKLLSLMDAYNQKPSLEFNAEIIQFLKERPTLLKAEGDEAFESGLFNLRDLISQKSIELPKLLVALFPVVPGKNKIIVKKFMSLYLDTDIEKFFQVYLASDDPNCMIVTSIADPVSEEAVYPLLADRGTAIATLLSKEGLTPEQRKLAESCQLVLQLHLPKIAPPPEPQEDTNEESP